MFERFTTRARTAVRRSREEARALGDSEIGPEHLLLGLLADADCVAAKVLQELGIDRPAVVRALHPDATPDVAPAATRDAEVLRAIGIDLDEVRRRAEEVFGPGALDRSGPRGSAGSRWPGLRTRRRFPEGPLGFGPEAKSALAGSLRAAVGLGHPSIGTEHLLLGILADEPSTATRALRRSGLTIDLASVRSRILDERGRAA